jgi:hypothetical protein
MSESKLRTSLLHGLVFAVGGLSIGASMAFASPPASVRADSGCTCRVDKTVTGHYDCASETSSSCSAGSIKCETTCAE